MIEMNTGIIPKKLKFLRIALVLSAIFGGVNAIAEETKGPKQRITYHYEGGYSPYKYFQADIALNPEGKWLATCSYQMHNQDEIKLAPLEMSGSVINVLLKKFDELDFFNLLVESFLAKDVGTTTISYQSPERQRTVSYIATKDERLERLSWTLRQAVGYSIYLKQIEEIAKGEVRYETGYPENPLRLGLHDFLDSEFSEPQKITHYWMKVISNKDLREKYGDRALEDLKWLIGRDFYEEAFFPKEGGYRPEVEYQMWLEWWEENKLKSRREWLIDSMKAGSLLAPVILADMGDKAAIPYLKRILLRYEKTPEKIPPPYSFTYCERIKEALSKLAGVKEGR